jgi:CotH kinase protein/Putative metal-binding motif/Lectin C-type domain
MLRAMRFDRRALPLLLLAACGGGGSGGGGPDGSDGGGGDVRAADGGSFPSDAHLDGWDGRTPEPGDVRLNELDCNGERVELANAGSSSRALDGLSLTDDLTMPTRTLALSGTLAAGERVVIDLSGFKVRCGVDNTFLLDGSALIDVAPAVVVPGGATAGRLPDITGEFTANTPTLGAVNRAWVDPSPALFAPFDAPVAIALTLDDAAMASLRSAPRTYVTAQATITAGGTTLGPVSIGVKLKGSTGSFRPLDDKPALKLDLDRVVKGQRLFGQAKLTLNNLAQDPSTVHEWLGYQLYAAMGIPSPRTGFAKLTLNGADYGSYLLLEDATGADFLAANFDTTLGLYEPPEGADVTPEQVATFDVKTGPADDFSALLAVAEPLANGARDGWFDAVGSKIDWDEVLRDQAVDVINGNPDGYAVMRNNYVLHVDQTGTLRMLPWGIDASFNASLPFFSSQGLLLSRCFEETRCAAKWVEALDAVQRAVSTLLAGDLPARARMLGQLNQQRFASDTRFGHDASQIPSAVDRALDRLAQNLSTVADRIACQRDSNADFDADGHRCELDCDEGDASRYRGAAEVCGDEVDQDCNGVLDDGASCPACDPVPGDDTLWVCPRAQAIDALRSACTALGAHPLVIDDAGENARAAAAASSWLGQNRFFIDLSDEATPDTFTWADGSGGSYRNFTGGYPYNRNPGMPARCAVVSPEDGTWITKLCSSRLPGMCER